MPSTTTPATTPSASKSEKIARLAGYANAVTALLETYHLTPFEYQADVLAVAGSMAEDIASDLAGLIEGAK